MLNGPEWEGPWKTIESLDAMRGSCLQSSDYATPCQDNLPTTQPVHIEEFIEASNGDNDLPEEFPELRGCCDEDYYYKTRSACVNKSGLTFPLSRAELGTAKMVDLPGKPSYNIAKRT